MANDKCKSLLLLGTRDKTQVKIRQGYDFKPTRVGNINRLIILGISEDEEPDEMIFISGGRVNYV